MTTAGARQGVKSTRENERLTFTVTTSQTETGTIMFGPYSTIGVHVTSGLNTRTMTIEASPTGVGATWEAIASYSADTLATGYNTPSSANLQRIEPYTYIRLKFNSAPASDATVTVYLK